MKQVTEITLSAFLHDIGKPMQRAEVPLSTQAQRMDSILCPTYQGRSSHLHVLWTNDCLENHLNWLPASLDKVRINQLASHHHRPSEPEHFIISEADRLASGHDRRPAEAADHPGFKSVPLLSIFGRLGFDGTSHDSGRYVPQLLRPDLSTFPVGDPNRSLVQEYQAIVKTWLGALNAWPVIPESLACAAVDSLSRRCFSFVAASTLDEPDVSLHDHARLTAAFAGAIHAYHRDEPALDEQRIRDRKDPKYLLISGDLSGIQSYLFKMPAEGRKGQTRAYRARSFYLSMLTHAAATLLLEKLSLPVFNVVMDAGGRFVVLAANTPSTLRILREAQSQIDDWIMNCHAGQLGLTIDGTVETSGTGCLAEGFPVLYRRIQSAVDAAKRHKLWSWLQSEGQWRADRQVLPYVHDRERMQQQYQQDVDLGRQLPDALYAGLWDQEPPTGGRLPQSRDVLGYRMQLYREAPPMEAIARAASFMRLSWSESDTEWIPHREMASYVPRLNAGDIEVLSMSGAGGRESTDPEEAESLRPGGLATFEHLALLSQRPSASGRGPRLAGQPAIACLKADADRLGFLFSRGFGEHISFGRVTTLSRMLDFFFRCFLPARFANTNGGDAGYRHVYTVFAGGDDLMLVGPWHVMLNLCRDIHDWFSRLAGGNPQVTISAGLAMSHARTPISSLARAAEEQLELSKGRGRNRITLFDESFTWDEYGSALEDARRLDGLLIAGDQSGHLPLNTGFVYRLLQYERMARRVNEARAGSADVKLNDLRGELTWRSHLSYDIERNIRRRMKGGDARAEEDLEWLESLVGVSMRSTPTKRLKLCATYALYRNRGG
ncbi:MAG TPA: hypothetical protein VLM89_08065 [Phycisphaerae bacterium]|nr:hypothetical protein [Phycisphaerae bacterium]